MLVTKKEQIKPDDTIWIGCDELPFDELRISEGVVKNVQPDFFIYEDKGIGWNYVWGDYNASEDENLVIFTTKEEVKEWAKKRKPDIYKNGRRI